MKMTFQEVYETCNDFPTFMQSKGIDAHTFATTGSMYDEVEISLDEAREHGIIKTDNCCKGGPQWGHAWDCSKQIG